MILKSPGKAVWAAIALVVAIGLFFVARWKPRQVKADGGAGVEVAAADGGADGSDAWHVMAGQVRMAGKAVAGAEVEIAGAGGEKRTVSGPDGMFTFPGLVEGVYALRATRESDAAWLAAVDVHPGSDLVTIELVKAVRVSGRLRDPGGVGIAEGEVTLMESAGSLLPRKTRSGWDGVFRFDGVLPGKYVVTARADGYLPSAGQAASAPGNVEIRLLRASCVDGRVVDESGRAVAGAQLEVSGEGAGGPIAVTAAAAAGPAFSRLEPAGELGVLRGQVPFPPSAPSVPAVQVAAETKGFVSDVKGAFKVCGVPPGRVVVAASHADFLRSASDPITLAEGAHATLQLVLRKGQSGGGLVLDDRGSPLGGARITITGGGAAAQTALSDRSGHFRAERLGAGPWSVEVAHPDFAPVRRDVVSWSDLTIDLHPGGGIDGELRDARTGATPTGVKLVLRRGGETRAIAHAHGRFSAHGLPPGPATLEASAPGYVTLSQAITITAGDRPREITLRDLRLDLDRGGSISGELRDDRGDALEGAVVTCKGLRTTTDARGLFHLDGIPSGRHTIEIDAAGKRTSEPVEVRPDDETRVEIRLR